MIILGMDEYAAEIDLKLTKPNLTKETVTFDEWISEAISIWSNIDKTQEFWLRWYEEGVTIRDAIIGAY